MPRNASGKSMKVEKILKDMGRGGTWHLNDNGWSNVWHASSQEGNRNLRYLQKTYSRKESENNATKEKESYH